MEALQKVTTSGLCGTCDIETALESLFRIASPLMKKDDMQWISGLGDYAEFVQTALADTTEQLGVLIANSGEPLEQMKAANILYLFSFVSACVKAMMFV